MPPLHAPVRNTDDSETRSENEIGVASELESQPDQAFEYAVENKPGSPEYQHIRSSPPPVDANITNELGGSEFFQRVVQKLTLWFAKTAYKVQISGNEGNETMNTDIVLSLGSEVRRTSSMNRHYGADLKIIQKNTKIKVKVVNSYHSNPTININIEQVHLRGKKHERGIEDFEGATNIHVQMKKIKK